MAEHVIGTACPLGGRAAGGALARMLPQFDLGMGGPVGSGKQWVSWVHSADLTAILLLALDTDGVRGPLNAMSPGPVTNRDFVQALGRALRRPAVMPSPAFAVRLMLGEVAEAVLTGQRVLPARLTALGFPFHFPTLDAALADLLKPAS